MGRSRYKFADPSLPHFLTLTVLHWIPVFTEPKTVGIVLDSLRYFMQKDMKVYAFVVLENHIHLVVQSGHLDKDISAFKSYTGKRLIEYLKKHNKILEQLTFYKKPHKNDRNYQFWEEGCHPQWIQNDEMMRNKVEYIHQNPVKRGYVDEAVHWRYSSARNYQGQAGLLNVYIEW